MNELTTRTPGLIAAEINHIKDETRKMVLYNSIEIGRKLAEAKELLPHGEWGQWLESEVDYSKSTANNLMKIFEQYGADQINLLGDNLKSQAFGDLTYSQAVLLLGVPANQREEFIETHDVDEMSTRELKKAIDDLKKSEEEKKQIERQLKEVNETRQALEDAFNESAKAKSKLEEETEKLLQAIKQKEEELEDLKLQPVEVNIDTTDMEIKYQEEINAAKREKEELEKKIEQLQAESGEATAKFKVHFDNIVGDFNKLLQEMNSIKNINEIQYTKLNGATRKFLNTMLDRL